MAGITAPGGLLAEIKLGLTVLIRVRFEIRLNIVFQILQQAVLLFVQLAGLLQTFDFNQSRARSGALLFAVVRTDLCPI